MGAGVEIVCRNKPWLGPWRGVVTAVEPAPSSVSRRRVRLHVEGASHDLPVGALVEARFRTPLAEIEPLRTLARDRASSNAEQAEYPPPGKVLAVPESAVIDTGAQQVVYVESGPGMFDAVAVKLGPKAGGYYSVIQGLQAGQRVAAAGAFLIDADTRLNPHLAAAYFGAGKSSAAGAGQPAGQKPASSKKTAPKQAKDYLAKLDLSPADRAAAEKQQVCPVTRLPLGSMGAPVRIESDSGVVFLCCEGCRAKFEEDQKTP
jgi:hypothetical protein